MQVRVRKRIWKYVGIERLCAWKKYRVIGKGQAVQRWRYWAHVRW